MKNTTALLAPLCTKCTRFCPIFILNDYKSSLKCCFIQWEMNVWHFILIWVFRLLLGRKRDFGVGLCEMDGVAKKQPERGQGYMMLAILGTMLFCFSGCFSGQMMD